MHTELKFSAKGSPKRNQGSSWGAFGLDLCDFGRVTEALIFLSIFWIGKDASRKRKSAAPWPKRAQCAEGRQEPSGYWMLADIGRYRTFYLARSRPGRDGGGGIIRDPPT